MTTINSTNCTDQYIIDSINKVAGEFIDINGTTHLIDEIVVIADNGLANEQLLQDAYNEIRTK